MAEAEAVNPTLLLILAAAAWGATTWWLHARRAWLPFYVTGALGFTLIIIFGAQLAGAGDALEAIEAGQVALIATAGGLSVQQMGGTGLAVGTANGWSIYDVGIECAALIETAAFAGLIGFYPAFSPRRKALTILAGAAATYVINILRILLIVTVVATMGDSWAFAAHAVFGRLFFFVLTIAVYWRLVTLPTMHIVSGRLGGEAA